MDNSKYQILKYLPFWNIIIMIILGVVGWIVATGIQDRVEEIEIENRAHTFRPKIELKYTPEISHIVLTRDTLWIRPDFDIDVKQESKDSIKDVMVHLHANFSFTLINNSEHIADLAKLQFQIRKSPKIETVKEIFENKAIEITKDAIIQLDNQDTTVYIIDTMQIGYSDMFYIHFIIFYLNQFSDFYQSYFIFECKIGEMPKYKIEIREDAPFDFLTIPKIFMKDNFIQIKPYSKFTYYLREDEKNIIIEGHKEAFEKLDFLNRQEENFLKNN